MIMIAFPARTLGSRHLGGLKAACLLLQARTLKLKLVYRGNIRIMEKKMEATMKYIRAT